MVRIELLHVEIVVDGDGDGTRAERTLGNGDDHKAVGRGRVNRVEVRPANVGRKREQPLGAQFLHARVASDGGIVGALGAGKDEQVGLHGAEIGELVFRPRRQRGDVLCPPGEEATVAEDDGQHRDAESEPHSHTDARERISVPESCHKTRRPRQVRRGRRNLLARSLSRARS